MKLTDLFIRRSVLALVVNLVIIIAGLQAIRTLNVRQYPRSENSTVTVTTVYVGASAELVRGFVTTKLERAIAAADGIDYIESQSSQSLSTIGVRLKLNYDSIKALSEISSKVDQVRNTCYSTVLHHPPEGFLFLLYRYFLQSTVLPRLQRDLCRVRERRSIYRYLFLRDIP